MSKAKPTERHPGRTCRALPRLLVRRVPAPLQPTILVLELQVGMSIASCETGKNCELRALSLQLGLHLVKLQSEGHSR